MVTDLDYRIWSFYRFSYKIAKKMLKCSDQASDVASETITQVLSILRSENPPELHNDPEPYIKKTTINLARNTRRRNKLRVSLDELNNDDSYMLNFDLFDLSNVLSKCNPDIAKLTLMKLEGYNTKECAEEFQTNENSLKVRWHRTKKMIIEEFD